MSFQLANALRCLAHYQRYVTSHGPDQQLRSSTVLSCLTNARSTEAGSGS